MFGKEAHTKQKRFNWLDGKNIYGCEGAEDWYKYDFEVFNGRRKDGKVLNTYYLKTRKLVAGLDNWQDKDWLKDNYNGCRQFTSIIANNLNKTSKNGKYASAEEAQMLYKKFEFEGIFTTIFLHEIRILKPRKIVLCIGKNYDEHIKRNFGENFFKLFITKLGKDIDNFGVNKNPFCKVVEFCEEDFIGEMNSKQLIKDIFCGEKIQVLYLMHPSSHMKKDK